MKVALVSYNPIWLKPIENIENCIQLVVRAHQESCQLIIFPEMAFTGFSPQYGCLEPSVLKYCFEKFRELSCRYYLDIVFGALSRHSSDLSSPATNDAYVISSKQDEIFRYSKVHVFSPGDEHLFVQAGSKLLTFSIEGKRFAPSICYDLRFPEIFSALSSDVDCFINIASWPSLRIDHWYALLRARAIENQAFTVGVNRTGKDGNGLLYERSSIVYDPNGNEVTLMHSSEDECFSCAYLDFSLVDKTRSKFDLLASKRHDLYKSFFASFE